MMGSLQNSPSKWHYPFDARFEVFTAVNMKKGLLECDALWCTLELTFLLMFRFK
jgi:hypothetical protein